MMSITDSSRAPTPQRGPSTTPLPTFTRRLEMLRVLLDNDWPLIMARNERPGDFTELNRHQVLHGEVVDYGTEENSLKAISLLNYCATVLPEPADDNGCE